MCARNLLSLQSLMFRSLGLRGCPGFRGNQKTRNGSDDSYCYQPNKYLVVTEGFLLHHLDEKWSNLGKQLIGQDQQRKKSR